MQAAAHAISDMVESRSKDFIDITSFRYKLLIPTTEYDSSFEKVFKAHNNKTVDTFCDDLAPLLPEKKENSKGEFSYPWKLLCSFWELYVEGMELEGTERELRTICSLVTEAKVKELYDRLSSTSDEDLIKMGRFTLSNYFQYIANFHTLHMVMDRRRIFDSDDPLEWLRLAREYNPRPAPYDMKRLSERVSKCIGELYTYQSN